MNGDMWVGVLILGVVVLIALAAVAWWVRRRHVRRFRPVHGKHREQSS